MIVVRRHHRLGLAEAKRLAEGMARRLQHEHGGTYSWNGNDLVFQRIGASGRVVVAKDTFEVRVELGFLLTPLSSRIEGEIRSLCDDHFGKDEPRERQPRTVTKTRREGRPRR
jgi:putative polyhydroxyalkanoate system protein